MLKILSNKWMSLACVMINSVFASVAWQNEDYVWAFISYFFAFLCGYNFMNAVKEDYYDQNGK